MASWTLVPCLASLRSEFNVLAPMRDKASDGAIGNQEHADRSSDHNPDETGATPSEDSDSRNEVHAIDVDVDLRKRNWTMAKAVQIIVTRHRDGKDHRLQNVIYNRRIWSASWGWTAREYTGSNPHDHHAHFSSRYTASAESNTQPWGLLATAAAKAPEEEIPVNQADFNKLMNNWADSAAGKQRLQEAAGAGVHNQRLGKSTETIGQDLQGDDAVLAESFAQVQAEQKRQGEVLAVILSRLPAQA